MTTSEVTHSYLIVIEQAADGGYGRGHPIFPAALRSATRLEDCKREMSEAVAFHLDGLRLEGSPIPKPSAVAAAMVTVPAA